MICHVLYAYNTRQKNIHSISSVCLSAYILTLTNLEELGQAVKGPHHHMRLSCQKLPSSPRVLLVPVTVRKSRWSNNQTRTHLVPLLICWFLDPLIKTFMNRKYFWKYASGTAILQWPPGCKTLKEAAAALITLVFCLFLSFLDWLFVFLWFVFLLFVCLLLRLFVCLSFHLCGCEVLKHMLGKEGICPGDLLSKFTWIKFVVNWHLLSKFT